jgi:hypothetical protein
MIRIRNLYSRVPDSSSVILNLDSFRFEQIRILSYLATTFFSSEKAFLKVYKTKFKILYGSRTAFLLVTSCIVSRTPCRRVVDTAGRVVARHPISV